MNFNEISSLLPDGSIGTVSLKNDDSSVFILFYPADFLTISREEVKELSDLHDEFESIKCQVGS
jgi:alkyl hydroperoxide reductase subunit AhpC